MSPVVYVNTIIGLSLALLSRCCLSLSNSLGVNITNLQQSSQWFYTHALMWSQHALPLPNPVQSSLSKIPLISDPVSIRATLHARLWATLHARLLLDFCRNTMPKQRKTRGNRATETDPPIANPTGHGRSTSGAIPSNNFTVNYTAMPTDTLRLLLSQRNVNKLVA